MTNEEAEKIKRTIFANRPTTMLEEAKALQSVKDVAKKLWEERLEKIVQIECNKEEFKTLDNALFAEDDSPEMACEKWEKFITEDTPEAKRLMRALRLRVEEKLALEWKARYMVALQYLKSTAEDYGVCHSSKKGCPKTVVLDAKGNDVSNDKNVCIKCWDETIGMKLEEIAADKKRKITRSNGDNGKPGTNKARKKR